MTCRKKRSISTARDNRLPWVRTSVVARLRAQAFLALQPGHSVFATDLAHAPAGCHFGRRVAIVDGQSEGFDLDFLGVSLGAHGASNEGSGWRLESVLGVRSDSPVVAIEAGAALAIPSICVEAITFRKSPTSPLWFSMCHRQVQARLH